MSKMTSARRNRYIIVTAVATLIVVVLYLARGSLFPFILGLVLAYLVLPFVNRLEDLMPRILQRRGWARIPAIIIVYLALIFAITISIFFLFAVVADQVNSLQEAIPELESDFDSLVNSWLEQYHITDWLEFYQLEIPPEIRQAIEGYIQRLIATVASALQRAASRTFSAISHTISFVLGIIIVPIWLFQIMNDEKKISKDFFNLVPASIRPDVRSILRLVDGILSAYLRGQLLLCVVVGAAATVGLVVIGVDFALVLGVIAGITEAIPNIGPIIGMIPALFIALLQDPQTFVFTLILYIAIQQVENVFLVPRITGETMQLSPAIVMFVLVIGSDLGGVWGMLMAAPITAIIRDIFHYLYLRSLDEPISPAQALARVRSEELQLEEV